MTSEKFLEIARKMSDSSALSKFEQDFCELCIRAPKEKSDKLIEALPEVVDKIIKSLEYEKEERFEKINWLKKELKTLEESIEMFEDEDKKIIRNWEKEIEIVKSILRDIEN